MNHVDSPMAYGRVYGSDTARGFFWLCLVLSAEPLVLLLFLTTTVTISLVYTSECSPYNYKHLILRWAGAFYIEWVRV